MRMVPGLAIILCFFFLTKYNSADISSGFGVCSSFYMFFNLMFVFVLGDCYGIKAAKCKGIGAFRAARFFFWRSMFMVFCIM